jgi:membrane protease YdiL (CAAX protease family)
MELVLSLVLLQLTLGLVAAQVVLHGSPAVAGLCFLAFLQLLAICALRRQCPGESLKNIMHVSFKRSFAMWTAFCIAGVVFMLAIEAVFFSTPVRLALFVKLMAAHWYGWLAGVFLIPIVEEIVFRAILIEIFVKKFRWQFAIALSAVFFGLIHGNIFQAIVATIFGVIFGIAYVKSKSLLPSIIGHLMLNAYTFWRISNVAVP